MHNLPPSPNANRHLRQGLLGLAFLGLVAMLSLPAARGAGPVGWMPMWLLGMPLAAFAALALAERFTRAGTRAAAAPVAAAASRRRARPAQARRRAPRRGAAGRRPGAPAAA